MIEHGRTPCWLRRALFLALGVLITGALLGPTVYIPSPWDGWIRLTLFRLATVVFVAVALAVVIRDRNFWSSLPFARHQPFQRISVFFAFWSFYAVASLAWVQDLGRGLRYLGILFPMMLLQFAIATLAGTRKKLPYVIILVLSVEAFIILFAVYEGRTGFHLPLSRLNEIQSNSVTSFFRNENDLATMITLALPFFWTATYLLRSLAVRIVCYSVAIVALVVLAWTESRLNVIATGLMFLLWLVILPKTIPATGRSGMGFRCRRFSVRLAGAAFLLLSLGLAWVAGQILIPEPKFVARDLKFHISELSPKPPQSPEVSTSTSKSLVIRINLQYNAWTLLRQSWFLGVGAGNLEAHMRNMPGVNEIVNLHNWWGEVAVNFGVVIAGGYVASYLWTLYRLWHLLQRSTKVEPVWHWLHTSNFMSATVLSVAALGPSTAVGLAPWWVHFGLAWAALAAECPDPQDDPQDHTAQPVRNA